MSTEIDSDQLFSARGSRADPMAEHKQRARWRLIGAAAYCVFVGVLAMQVLRDKPRHLAPEFTVVMPLPGLTMSGRPLPELEGDASAASTATAEPAVASTESSAGQGDRAASPAAAGTNTAVSAANTPSSTTPANSSGASPVPPARQEEAKPAADTFYVQMGAYSSRASAETVRKRMESSGHRCFISAVGSGSNLRYRVRVGPLSRDEAESVRARAKLQGYDAAVVK